MYGALLYENGEKLKLPTCNRPAGSGNHDMIRHVWTSRSSMLAVVDPVLPQQGVLKQIVMLPSPITALA